MLYTLIVVKCCPQAFGPWAAFDNFGSTNSHDARGIRHNLYSDVSDFVCDNTSALAMADCSHYFLNSFIHASAIHTTNTPPSQMPPPCRNPLLSRVIYI